MSPILLQGVGVEKRFGRVPALRGIDFEIHPGESVSILGANGAGKSTLLRIIAGLSRPSHGQFQALRQSAAGDDGGPSSPAGPNTSTALATSTAALRRDVLRGEVGYVGHATLVYAELSARENLAFAAQLHGQSPNCEQIDTTLDEVGLLEFADRRAGTFSRGMAQRLSIARAIIHSPHVLLLDEPFTGLDENSAERLSAQLAALHGGDRILLLVTHDPRRAIELSDRALILHRGEIRARPSHDQIDSGTQARDDGADVFELTALRETLGRLASEGSPPVDNGSDSSGPRETHV
ncbi:MAG: ABC transporter ATP-binding protein [Myxococcales bacterium]|nr:ABC transporter ATP-binding protein [Myxococcales bacterium]HIK84844.1 ABC transporter ATP-binding protein [Myxococcales bacterium]